MSFNEIVKKKLHDKINSGTRTKLLASKYSSCPSSSRLTAGFPAETQHLLEAAFCQATWRKHEAAFNCFKKFEDSTLSHTHWPIPINVLYSFTTWACNIKKLKSSTVESYLSSLKTIHSLRLLDCAAFDNFVLKSILRGKENLEIYSLEGKPSRKVMNLHTLKLLGHEIAISNWEENSKQTVWSAFTLAFFGSFRMGEILSQSESSFSPSDTLLWEDVKFISSSHVLIHIKTPKSRLPLGEFVDIFSFPGHGVCPVSALSALKESLVSPSPTSPVFQFRTGLLLTRRTVNSMIPQLLHKHLGQAASELSGHSFRAGIPAVLACHPDVASSSDIMGWGRWKSEAYLSYTRLKHEQKRKTFQKIANILNL